MSKIKNKLLPPSSESFHWFESETISRLDQINKKLDEQNTALHNRIDALEKINQIQQRRNYYYQEALLRDKETKDTFKAHVKLFKNLPEATGAIRICQQATTKLMRELEAILEKHKLPYWFGYGSLLGAYTRNGPIPWDDDIDICMCRQDLETLVEILKDNKDYQITIIYDKIALCIQYRFCCKNRAIPSFIDIGVWDYCINAKPETEEIVQKERAKLMEQLIASRLPYWEERKYLFDLTSGYLLSGNAGVTPEDQDKKTSQKEIKKIKTIFKEHIDQLYSMGIFCNKIESKAISYSLDNLTMPGRRMVYEKSIFYPLKKTPYDGISVSTPNKTEDFLNFCYSNWPFLPNDESILEQGHFDKDILQDEQTKKAITEFVNS